MAKKDYYDVLGVERGADEKAIKRAYKKLAMQYHPDRTKGDKAKEEKFKEIQEAYEILGDKEKRAAYDQYGHAAFEQGGMGGGGFGGGRGFFGELRSCGVTELAQLLRLDSELPVSGREALLIVAGHISDSPDEGELLGVCDTDLLTEGDLTAEEAQGHLEVGVILLYGLLHGGQATDEFSPLDFIDEKVRRRWATLRELRAVEMPRILDRSCEDEDLLRRGLVLY